jgi:integrase
MRFTGLRVSQAVGLGWRDVDLVRGILRVRAGVEGAKRSATRVVPIHAELAERMATWPLGDDGLVFPLAAPHPGRVRRGQASDGERVLRRAEYARNAYRRAWEAAGVAPEKWDVIEGDDDVAGARAHGSPCHAFRRCIRVELIRMGVEEAIALYLVGQTQGITAAAYVPEDDPESSPYWPRLVDAVSRIPRIGQARPSTPSANNTPELV